uniref:Golgi associated, gamma adaptin ear containing, ARF binding protein 2 n=1 Tax=Chelonoidis abingdonii TaxID=106734 RepID=A0A8C0HHN3_CHEAB
TTDGAPGNKATDPSIPEENWECIQRFCDQVNADPEGPSIAPRLLAHKIQSPQEMEALHALTVLETCVNNCGERFHNEVAKFRFLNELIKVLSPKYLGTWSTEKVKSRVVEIMFSWTVWFPQEVKIRDAYQMLKKQGIIKQDPKLLEDKILPPPSPRPKNSIFDVDEEKSKLLARLLKSNHPEDLQAANRLIKSMIKEEQEKSAKVSKRLNAIAEVHSSVKLLGEMLTSYKRQELSKSDLQILQSLFERCEKLRALLFRLASETTDDDEALAEILQANDKLTQALGLYRQVVVGHDQGRRSSVTSSTDASGRKDPTGSPTAAKEPASWLVYGNVSFSLFLILALSCSLSEGRGSSRLSVLSLTGSIPPVTVYDKDGFKVMIHFSRDLAPGRPDVLVMVLSMLSTSTQPIKDIVFQAAVPKVMRVKLQPASGSELPAFSPLLPPAVISQVLLLANPHRDPIRLRYKLMFMQGGRPFSEVGEVTGFPEAELWPGS